MSTVNIPPLQHDPAHVDQVIQKLYQYKQKNPKELRNKQYTLGNGESWTSWTMRETVYRRKASVFPTMARGLFTRERQGQFEVMVRGYDKFFNVLETSATQWPALASETEGPYEVTAKENGCIIFIAALSSEKVVVTSKHAIPLIQDDSQAHAGVGYRWLLTHLASVEKSEADLAHWLSQHQITLVAELCDDAFEEHVLAYAEKERGLYLHGVNYNTVELETLASVQVQQLAHDFGFHATDYQIMDSIDQVKQMAEVLQQTGIFQGREVEGAVVRCRRKGHDFMFKIKSEPYLMYREYREVTHQLLDKPKEGGIRLKEKGVKMNYEKTRFYVDWLRLRVVDHPEWFQEYGSHKGIVQVRVAFEKDWENGQFLSK